MEICASKLSLVCFFLLFVLLQQGRSQNLVSGDMDSLALGLIDTNAFLEGRWKSIEHQIEIENISTAQKLLGEYRSIAHYYGFRFENEFRRVRSIFSYNYLGDELFVLEDAGNDLDIYSIIKPEYQEKFALNNNEKIQRDVLEVIPLPTVYFGHLVPPVSVVLCHFLRQ